MKQTLARWLAIASTSLIFNSNCTSVGSQIVPDDTLGNESSQVRDNQNINNLPAELIEGGAQRENNLFHSFSQFNIEAGQGAYFANPEGITNIFSRVTGGNASEIMGRLGVQGNADLFFINPNGIIFGENSSLDINGSFTASSADSILFGNGVFSAVNPEAPPLLTVNMPLGLNLGTNPGEIVNNSTADNTGLQVLSGQNISLIGGEIKLNQGLITAPGGKVELGGLASTGFVTIDQNSNFDFPQEVGKADISLTNGAFVDVRGDGGGSINLNGNNIELTQASSLLSGIAENSGSSNAQAGNVTLNAAGAISLNQSSRIENQVNQNSIGNSGDIIINARSLSAQDGSVITADISGQGDGGLVSIQASDNVELLGTDTAIFSDVNPSAQGNAGGIEINAGSLTISDGAIVSRSVFGQGDGGNININAEDTVTITGLGRPKPVEGNISNSPGLSVYSIVTSQGQGNSGNININAGTFSLNDFLTISSSNSSLQEGNSGDISITAQNNLLISGSGISTVRSSVNENGQLVRVKGNAGIITLKANRIETELDSFIDSSILGDGDSGDILFQANSIALIDPFIRSEIFGDGQAGDLDIIAEDSLLLMGDRTLEPTVTIQTFGSSQGGNINLQGKSVAIEAGIVLNAISRAEGDGGNIEINANQLKLKNVLIDASSLAMGNAGTITIDTTESVEVIGFGFAKLRQTILDPALENPVVIENIFSPENINNINSRSIQGIVAITAGSGDAGDITINTPRLKVLNGSIIGTASIRDGAAGSIMINTSESLEIDQAIISASTLGARDAGSVEVNTGTLSISNGGQLVTTTLGTGDAGSLTINATELVELRGVFGNGVNPSSLLVGSQRVETAGDGGNLNIVTPSLTIEDGAAIAATTLGQGNGGNINLEIENVLRLDSNSNISTSAGIEGAGGNGGNIDIATGFLVTSPSENSDIDANAFQGRGGAIDISAQGIFGIEEREQQTPLSDITASSQQNPQLDGEISIEITDNDLDRELTKLPEGFIDISTLIQTACPTNNLGSSSTVSQFIVTGRGGLPPEPEDNFRLSAIAIEENALKPELTSSQPQTTPPEIVEATEWMRNAEGKIILVASPSTTSSFGYQSNSTCSS